MAVAVLLWAVSAAAMLSYPYREHPGSPMAVFELVIALLFVGALLAAWARRVNAPYPATRNRPCPGLLRG